MADDDGDAASCPDQSRVELHPRHEHEEDHPELGAPSQRRHDLAGEEPLDRVRPDGTEDRRSEEHADEDLPDYSRLPSTTQEGPDNRAGAEYHCHGEQQMSERG